MKLKQNEITALKDFIQVNLRKAVHSDPQQELAIQNSLETLLVGRGLMKGIDYDREVGRVKISIKESKPDFVFVKLGLALEVKLSKGKDRSKAIVDEINADIAAYSKIYPSMLFIIYDLGSIRDETEFKGDLEKVDSVSIVIVKH